jgi:hypothetical protein
MLQWQVQPPRRPAVALLCPGATPALRCLLASTRTGWLHLSEPLPSLSSPPFFQEYHIPLHCPRVRRAFCTAWAQIPH